MPRRAWNVAVICLAALGQFWVMSSLLLTRQVEILLLAGMVAGIGWFWCARHCFLRKRRACFLLSGLCLLATIALTALCLLDLPDTGAPLLRRP